MVSLITPDQLAAMTRAEPTKYVVVDARPQADFAGGHIPGAISMGWENWCESPPATCEPILQEPGYWGVIGDPVTMQLANRIGAAGISSESCVVVYADGAMSKGREGRIAWMLLYLGVSSVCLLNGGWTAWKSEGYAVETEQRRHSRNDFRLELQRHRRSHLSELQQLHEANQMPLMIDTRTKPEFNGDCFDYQPRKGRMPNSILFPYDGLFDLSGAFISQDNYLQSIPSRILSASSLVAYCEVGVRASTFALIHEAYTGKIVPVFDGSIMQWGLQSSLVIAYSD
jgi:thiosulfate/3-mercaptopyruvate sulfurtransferase